MADNLLALPSVPPYDGTLGICSLLALDIGEFFTSCFERQHVLMTKTVKTDHLEMTCSRALLFHNFDAMQEPWQLLSKCIHLLVNTASEWKVLSLKKKKAHAACRWHDLLLYRTRSVWSNAPHETWFLKFRLAFLLCFHVTTDPIWGTIPCMDT